MSTNKRTIPNKIIKQLGSSSIIKTKKTSVTSWVIFLIIATILILPTLFKNQIYHWLIKEQEKSIFEARILRDDKSELKLHIPKIYTTSQVYYRTRQSIFEKELEDFTIVARLPDMSPLPYEMKKYYTSKRLEHKNIPDPILVFLISIKLSYNPDKHYELYNLIKKNFSSFGEGYKAHDLDLVKGVIAGNDLNNNVITEGIIATSKAPKYKDSIIVCSMEICSLTTSIPQVSIFIINFSESNLHRWKEIHDKSHELIKKTSA